ncbi:hypothetical protein [Mycobacterium deserti]|uniref:Uncharacterized protein n=1 Tax=Mycobacterium deserti TaxID=2978347 RepID=A0ABT2MB25_9MYCO|nr:hypothetical protein [Mycobacterium deserti]MCT7658615.1 hypothetical protein [Mycobacterium deserti]
MRRVVPDERRVEHRNGSALRGTGLTTSMTPTMQVGNAYAHVD